MPLFRKQSTTAKKRLQHQLYLAREAPEKTYDISHCEITDIPSGTFSLCKVLQKEALIAHTNWLSSLKGGGDLKDLSHLRVFDLHGNELTTLPDDINHLKHLQVLNIENNRLKHLPGTIGELPSLQTLNLRGNKLKDIPESVKSLHSLRTLDISSNQISRLPKELCQARTLENLILDSQHMSYPPAEVCERGTEAMMTFLCQESGIQYEPPSKFVLDALDGPISASVTPSLSNNSLKADFDAMNATVQRYHLSKATKQRELRVLEQQMEEDNRLQAKLAAESARSKKHLMDFVAHDQERVMDELNHLQLQKDKERKQLVQTLYDSEINSSQLVSHLLELNERAKKTEELLDKMEQERIESEEWFKVRQEEETNLRKHEVLAAMEDMLASNDAMNRVIQDYLSNKDEVTKRAQHANEEANGLLENVLATHDVEQQGLVDYLLKEVQLQKEAFEALQLKKDAKHTRISGQIDLIHKELAQLTVVEIEQKNIREESQKDMLVDRRQALTDLLIQLMKEKDLRENELKKRMLEMEEQREDHQTDYWLIQYQRLMDKKPQSLIDQEKQLEYAVVHILEAAAAQDYIPVFARHRVSIETLCSLTEDDLKQMGMYELGLRKAVLREVKHYMERLDEERAAAKKKHIEEDWHVTPPSSEAAAEYRPPSAPQKSPMTPTSPPLEVVARGMNSECVICMERQSSMLFLYCGHVCSCQPCAEPLTHCPMCRGEIIHRIILPSNQISETL